MGKPKKVKRKEVSQNRFDRLVKKANKSKQDRLVDSYGGLDPSCLLPTLNLFTSLKKVGS